MPVALLVLIAFEGFRAGSRQYNKVKAKKYNYDGVFRKDSLGRPVDETTGKRLSRNEARALAEHRRGTAKEAAKEREWKKKGDTLPDYKQASTTLTSRRSRTPSASSYSEDSQDEEPSWQDWSVLGAPCYTEHDEIAAGSQVVQRH